MKLTKKKWNLLMELKMFYRLMELKIYYKVLVQQFLNKKKI